MSQGDRHFAKYEPNGEEVVVLGHRKSTNEVLVAFPSAMPQEEARALRKLAQTDDAQKRDYLLGQDVNSSVLMAAHHPTAGANWQEFLIRQAATGRSGVARKVTMKDLNFYDSTQKAFYAGYGDSVEPDVEAARQEHNRYHESMRSGITPEMPQQTAPAPAAPSEDTNAALIAALTALTEGQKAINDRLDALETKPARAKRTTTRRKTSTANKRKTAPKKAEQEPVTKLPDSPIVSPVVEAEGATEV